MASAARILLVEDSDVIYEQISDRLAESGHVVMGADARDALEVARGFAPDLIVVDLGQVDFRRVDLVRELRANFPSRAVELIALTSSADHASLGALQSTGCDHVFQTGHQPAQLERVIERVVSRRDQARQGAAAVVPAHPLQADERRAS